MYLLRNLVYSTDSEFESPFIFEKLLVNLKGNGIAVLKGDRNRGILVVRCLTTPVNLILWRCWSDKLVFELSRLERGGSRVRVYSIPSLFRMSVKETEKVLNARALARQLLDAN